MRIIGRFALLSMFMGSSLVFGAPPDSTAPPKADIPPPPGINDPGVAASPAQALPAAGATEPGDADPLAPLPKPDTRIVRSKADRDPTVAQRMATSEHLTRQQDGDTVDEYRQNGKVWMIHIVPRGGGPDETFMDTTGTGRLTRDPRQGPVSPVYFSLYDWN